MFLALRDLRFARGRFALMGAVVALIAVLGVLLSGLASGLADAGISGLRALPVSHFAFDEKATSEQFSRSTVGQADWQAWGRAPGVEQAEPFGNTLANAQVTVGAEKGEQINLAVFGMAPDSSLAPDPTKGERLKEGSDGVLITREIADTGVEIGDVLTADVADVEKATGTHAATKEEAFGASPGYAAESSTMALIKGFLYAISALVIGAFFTVWTVQRKAEIALLKARIHRLHPA